jgi:hypothetical protein
MLWIQYLEAAVRGLLTGVAIALVGIWIHRSLTR